LLALGHWTLKREMSSAVDHHDKTSFIVILAMTAAVSHTNYVRMPEWRNTFLDHGCCLQEAAYHPAASCLHMVKLVNSWAGQW
jgi:hypothetical protein